MSVWLPVALVPSTFICYYWILPEILLFKSAIIDKIDIRLTTIEQHWCELKLAVVYIIEYIAEKLSGLKHLFFFQLYGYIWYSCFYEESLYSFSDSTSELEHGSLNQAFFFTLGSIWCNLKDGLVHYYSIRYRSTYTFFF